MVSCLSTQGAQWPLGRRWLMLTDRGGHTNIGWVVAGTQLARSWDTRRWPRYNRQRGPDAALRRRLVAAPGLAWPND